jgi:hypothetical protein
MPDDWTTDCGVKRPAWYRHPHRLTAARSRLMTADYTVYTVFALVVIVLAVAVFAAVYEAEGDE